MKVAIVGLAASADLAPWDDPAWELWGLTWGEHRVRLHRTFEMHCMKTLQRCYPDLPRYLESLADCASPYMQERYAEVPNSRRYPLEEVSRTCGDYFSSSIGYAMALAIHEGAEEIGIYGVNMDVKGEYGYQKPNMEYLIGLARGKGIKVHIPEACPLCKYADDFGYIGRYGWLG